MSCGDAEWCDVDDPEFLALVNAEIDGELDARQRAELARRLLADPQARAAREELLRLTATLGALGDAEPPAALRANIVKTVSTMAAPRRRSPWAAARWRYAALIAGILGMTAVVYESVDGTGAGSADLAAGTIAAQRAPVTLDTVVLGEGPVTGRVHLYREGSARRLAFELTAGAPVDVLISSDGRTLRVNDLGRSGSADPRPTVALPEASAEGSHEVDLTFLMAGREVARARLAAPEGH
jgi:anti-sigma factor RsiW